MRWYLRISLSTLILALVSTTEAQTVRISSVGNLSLGAWSGNGDLQAQDTLCIYNLGNSNYRVRATGSGTAGAFTLANGGHEIDYEVHFQDTGAFVQLTAGSYADFAGADTSHDDCQGVNNATVKVIARASELGSVPPGAYSGTLTLLLGSR